MPVLLKGFVKRRVRDGAGILGGWFERRHNEDIAIATALRGSLPAPAIDFPGTYVGFLRDCIRFQRHRLREVKTSRGAPQEATSRFATAVDVLRSNVPAISLGSAQEIGRVADALQGSTQTHIYGGWTGDVGLHAGGSSSFGRQGRVIACVLRFMRSNRCLELGTAYGLSALFAVDAMQRNGNGGHLTTLEAAEPQFSLASGMLRDKHEGSVSCHKGMTYEALPHILPALGTLDFLYHDAGHSLKDYVTDFGLVEPYLGPGATVLLDDINWSNPRFYDGDPQTYAGWQAIVANERVARAVEIDATLGLLLLK